MDAHYFNHRLFMSFAAKLARVKASGVSMNQVIYLVGLVVVVMAILSFVGLR
jgi:hypothetical protein